MREVKHSALVGKPPALLFTLINDIESYPQFLPWCTHSKVQSRSEREIVATVGVKRGPLQGEFTTRNELEPDRRILMHLVSGPFRMLEGEWLLTPIGTDGCRAELCALDDRCRQRAVIACHHARRRWRSGSAGDLDGACHD